MAITWVLLADRSGARIFANRGPGKGLELIFDLEHPEGHWQDRDIVTDKPGRVFDRNGDARHATESQELPHEREAANFARTIAERLRLERIARKYDRLVIAAEPSFLGRLRQSLDEPTRKLVTGELAKHLLAEDEREITEQLGAVMNI